MNGSIRRVHVQRMLYLQDDGNAFREWRRSWHHYDSSISVQHIRRTCLTYAIASISVAYTSRYPRTGPVLRNISSGYNSMQNTYSTYPGSCRQSISRQVPERTKSFSALPKSLVYTLPSYNLLLTGKKEIVRDILVTWVDHCI